MKEKNYLLFIFFLFISFIFSNYVTAEIKGDLIKKIQDTETLVFDFEQKIKNKIETGNCYVKYSKLLMCDYNDKYKKRLISNGKSLAIIQKKYKKISLYPLKTTPLFFLLDKKYLIEYIKKNDPIELNNQLIKYAINEKNKVFNIFFDKKSLNLKGWTLEDIYKNKVEFLVINPITNIPVNKKLFKIPNRDDL